MEHPLLIRSFTFLGVLFVSVLQAQAEQVNLFIDLYGVRPHGDWRFEVYTHAGAGLQNPPIEYRTAPPYIPTIEDRLDYGIRIRASNVFVAPEAAAILVFVSATSLSRSDEGGEVFYFPIHYLTGVPSDDANWTLYSTTVRAFSDSQIAIRNSFPFLDRGESVQITRENISLAINSIRWIVRFLSPDDERWDDVFLVYQENAELIAQDTEMLREILRILHDYAERDVSDGFFDFYIRFLLKMVQQDLGTILRVDEETLMNDYFWNEIAEIVSNRPTIAFPLINDLLEAYGGSSQFRECITLSTHFFLNLQVELLEQEDVWLSMDQEQLEDELRYALIAATVCAQQLYVKEVEDGSRGNVAGGANFIVNHGGVGREFAEAFVDILDMLEELGINIDSRSISDFRYHYGQEIQDAERR
ncbi:hypothetical protein HKCCE3408_01055 [Rhodobacterales bacterium HKCCE3408]|nr:hypothetical protein [Rhodobacterales bacterium HKCCE3408]